MLLLTNAAREMFDKNMQQHLLSLLLISCAELLTYRWGWGNMQAALMIWDGEYTYDKVAYKRP